MSAKRWCFTLNNYSPQEEQLIHNAHAQGGIRYLVSGRENGQSGTPHLQGFVAFDSRRSLIQVKAVLGARLHLEIARGSNEEASNYCKKDGEFVEYGSLPPSPGHRSDWDRYREWVETLGRVPTDREIAREFTSLFARYSEKCRVIAKFLLPVPRVLPDGATLRDWQLGLRDRLIEPCTDDRTILFYVDTEGNTGKSWFCSYMLEKYPERTQTLGVGKVVDIAYMIDEDKDIVLIDCERSASEYLQYRVLEQMKNRRVCSTKYAGQMKILSKLPHVVVFMNEQPDMSKLSTDRYEIENIL